MDWRNISQWTLTILICLLCRFCFYQWFEHMKRCQLQLVGTVCSLLCSNQPTISQLRLIHILRLHYRHMSRWFSFFILKKYLARFLHYSRENNPPFSTRVWLVSKVVLVTWLWANCEGNPKLFIWNLIFKVFSDDFFKKFIRKREKIK